MNQDELYEAWKQARARADVPVDFADRVLDAVRARQAARSRRSLLVARALVFSRAGKVALCSLACAAYLVRALQVVGLFLFVH
jgi:hypothetical protein